MKHEEVRKAFGNESTPNGWIWQGYGEDRDHESLCLLPWRKLDPFVVVPHGSRYAAAFLKENEITKFFLVLFKHRITGQWRDKL